MNILIIGATSGIGYTLAKMYAARPNTIVGATGRRQKCLDELQHTSNGNILTEAFDATAPNAIDSIHHLISRMGKVDLIIYSAGYGARSDNFDWKITEQTIQINVMAFTRIANEMFNYLKAQGGGHFTAIASIAGIRGLSNNNAYSASKSYMLTYLEDLRFKSLIEKANIVITTLIPGFVDTDLIEGGDSLFWIASKEKAATQIIHALDKKRKIAYITKRWRIIAFALRIMPDFILRRLLK